MCPVSSRRSSNRTCRFPASGSHAWVSGLRFRHGRPTVRKLVEAEHPIEILVRVLAVPGGASLACPPGQPSLQTAPSVILDHPVCADDATLIEVARPAAQERVQCSNPILSRFQIPSWSRLVVDPLDDTLERFPGRLRADEGTSAIPVEPPNRVPEEVKRLL